MNDNEETEGDQPAAEICATCNSVIPEGAPGGICPTCALIDAAAPAEKGTLPMTGPRFEAPSLEKIAEAFPHLEIIELIGCGGMGAVYQARQPNLDRAVALKILPPSLAESPAFTERFSREGRLLAKLSHPNIVGVHDFGESGGFFFLLMEFVDGVNLRQAMRAGRFTPEQALGIVPEVCDALQFAHDEGVLHRDIKPENILLDAKGRVKIADFGIAKLIGEGASNDTNLTGTMMPGTPQYMAPEQIEHPEDVDHRADIFSLGVVFYEMLTGELPMGRFSAPSEKSDVDSQVDEIVFRSLEKERSLRQQSADQVKTEIEGIPVEALTKMRHPGYEIPAAGEVPHISSGGNRAAWFVATGLVLLLVFCITFFFARQASIVKMHQDLARTKRAEVEAVEREPRFNVKVVELQNLIRQNPESPDADAARKELAELNAELEKNPIQRITEVSSIVHVTPIGPVVLIGLLLLGACIPGTIMGWKSLRRIRALGLTKGRGGALFAALLWPLLFLSSLFFGFIALILTLAPWIGGFITVFILLIWGTIIWLVIWLTRKWLDSTPTEQERTLALAQLSRPKNPWLRRILWLLAILTIVPVLLVFAPRTGFALGAVELLIIGGIFAGFVILIAALFRKGKASESAQPAAETQSNQNPWPRRLFWLIIVIFVLPPVMLLFGLVVPYFAMREGPKSHTVQVQDMEQVENVVRFNIYTHLNGKDDVVFKFRYDGPDFPFEGKPGQESLLPGDTAEWRINESKGTHYERISLAFPDNRRANMAAQRIRGTMQQTGKANWDISQILFFDMTAAEGGSWRARLDVESISRP